MSPTPLELAEDFTLYLPPRKGYLREVTDEYVLTTGNMYATVTRIRLGPRDLERAVNDVRGRLACKDIETITWWCGENATPRDLPERLLALGLTPDEPQLWEIAQEQGAVHYLAYLDGEPVAQARAFFLD
ncbi:MAG TPA: hypothetical protein VGU02_03355 [Gaiellaceae bacterium]|nr:hypothetical protein [Gaiellaceae bacterium]